MGSYPPGLQTGGGERFEFHVIRHQGFHTPSLRF
jgi:hypothetical protein